MGYVLIPKNLYDTLTTDEYDDRPWTSEKRDVLAWEAVPWTIGDHGLQTKADERRRSCPSQNTGGGNRTHTGLPPEDFKSSASAVGVAWDWHGTRAYVKRELGVYGMRLVRVAWGWHGRDTGNTCGGIAALLQAAVGRLRPGRPPVGRVRKASRQ